MKNDYLPPPHLIDNVARVMSHQKSIVHISLRALPITTYDLPPPEYGFASQLYTQIRRILRIASIIHYQ